MLKRLAALLALIGFQNVSAQIAITNFTSTEGFVVNGLVKTTNGALVLTPPQPSQVSSVWAARPQSVDAFSTVFTFRITEGGNGGGDGFALVIQNADTGGVTSTEGGIGYAGIPRSVAIEFDSWHNPSQHDPNDNHIAVHSRGSIPNTNDGRSLLGAFAVPFDLQDGSAHEVRIIYSQQRLSIWVDPRNQTGEAEFVLRLNIPSLIGTNRAYVGFTASTGFAYQKQEILKFSFNPPTPTPEVFQLSGLHSGLTLKGTPGGIYDIQFNDALPGESWKLLERILLRQPTSWYFDPSPATSPHRFYRAVPAQN